MKPISQTKSRTLRSSPSHCSPAALRRERFPAIELNPDSPAQQRQRIRSPLPTTSVYLRILQVASTFRPVRVSLTSAPSSCCTCSLCHAQVKLGHDGNPPRTTWLYMQKQRVMSRHRLEAPSTTSTPTRNKLARSLFRSQ